MAEFAQNSEMTYIDSPYVAKNTFLTSNMEKIPLPTYEEIADRLPKPIFEGHEDYIECYNTAWKIAFSNLSHPYDGSGFVSDFIDTAFNGCLFMWDSSFIMMFTKYAEHIFPFQKTLDNFYALQHRDGFICREINEKTGKDRFTRFDISSTGPNILPMAEWLYFQNHGDVERLKKVYAPLRAYHLFLRNHHTWRDGSYYSSGWGCGMDNLPRLMPQYHPGFSHGKMIWSDICMQQIISAEILMKMNKVLGDPDDVSDLQEEKDKLTKLINEVLWDENTEFYYDLWENDQLSMVKHIGAYWALWGKIVPKERMEGFLAHLENEKEFNRPNRIPALSADHPKYSENGAYWCGGVWAPTNYMVLCGLTANGQHDLAYRIADTYLKNIVQVWKQTNTLYENYAPESAKPGAPAKADFVGWTGLAPISIFFEYLLGIRPKAEDNCIIWHVNRTEKHGICNYPFGKDTVLDLICQERTSIEEEPILSVKSNRPVEIVVLWQGKEKRIQVLPEI